MTTEKYALLGTYDTRNNVEVIAFSDNPRQLKQISTAILNLNHELRDRDRGEITDKAQHIVDTLLNDIEIYDEYTEYVYEITVMGIIEFNYI